MKKKLTVAFSPPMSDYITTLKSYATLFLTSHHEQRSPPIFHKCCYNFTMFILSRTKTALLTPLLSFMLKQGMETLQDT